MDGRSWPEATGGLRRSRDRGRIVGEAEDGRQSAPLGVKDALGIVPAPLLYSGGSREDQRPTKCAPRRAGVEERDAATRRFALGRIPSPAISKYTLNTSENTKSPYTPKLLRHVWAFSI